MTEQPTPTLEDVLDAVVRNTKYLNRPFTLNELTRDLVPGTRPDAEAKRAEYRPAILAALTSLTEDGYLVTHTGQDWLTLRGVEFPGRQYYAPYYATRAAAERWRQDAQAAATVADAAKADAYALEQLRKHRPEVLARYHREYHARNTGS